MSTRATPLEDGTWKIDGTKIFISGGDHDMTDNVVHLLLAKVPNDEGKYVDDLATVMAFMVPKMTIEPDGSLAGKGNGVTCASVEHKMGIRGNATCVLNFEDAIGIKLGSIKKDAGADSKSSGMSAMFDMMNHARLGTGIQAMALSSAAYAKSADYARDRTSGKAAKPENRTGGRADPIIVHPDVRRMLRKQAAFVEGARAVGLWVALLLDQSHLLGDADVRRASLALASFLTPVIKAYFADRGFDASNLGVQVYGGHGYIRESGIEQHVRDGRILQLYERSNGIQARDLVARKLPAGNGAALRDLLGQMKAFVAEHRDTAEIADQLEALEAGIGTIEAAVAYLMAQGRDLDKLGAASYDVASIVGTVTLGFLWARMGAVAAATIAAGEGDAEFYRRKLMLGRFWALREMPQTQAALAAARAGADTLMRLPVAAF